MEITLQDLRNQATAAFADFMEYRLGVWESSNTSGGLKRPGTMRQVWQRNKRLVRRPGITSSYQAILSKMDQACEVYYHAKEYGLQSAMLLKLSYDH